MINLINLELFKCFEILNLPVAPLTLLSGTNASGKSSVLQAIVLLHQTMLDHEWSNRLQLNGSELQLGTFGDVMDKVHGRQEFGIGIEDDTCVVSWGLEAAGDKDALSAGIKSVTVNGTRTEAPEKLHYLFPDPLGDSENLTNRLRRLTYLTAERVGPRDNYSLRDPNVTQVVGSKGENAVGLLHQKREHDVS